MIKIDNSGNETESYSSNIEDEVEHVHKSIHINVPVIQEIQETQVTQTVGSIKLSLKKMKMKMIMKMKRIMMIM